MISWEKLSYLKMHNSNQSISLQSVGLVIFLTYWDLLKTWLAQEFYFIAKLNSKKDKFLESTKLLPNWQILFKKKWEKIVYVNVYENSQQRITNTSSQRIRQKDTTVLIDK
jgi:hypothetical protein